MNTNISVIIPTIGRHPQLKNCLISLLGQTILPDEIVVVDNTNQKQALAIIENISHPKKVMINYVWEPKKGVAYARNAGLRRAKYDLIAFVDDDCVTDKNWIKNIIFSSKKNPYLILQGRSINGLPDNIYSCVEHFNTECFVLSEIYKDDKNQVWSKMLITRNCAFRKSIFRKPLFFDTRFSYFFEDTDFSFQAREKGISILYQPKIFVTHFGRTNFINHFKRLFHCGPDFSKFQKKWHRKEILPKEMEMILQKYSQKKMLTSKNKLKREILPDKSAVFILLFEFFLFFDKIVIYLGALWERIGSAKSFTKIFLPRRIFTNAK